MDDLGTTRSVSGMWCSVWGYGIMCREGVVRYKDGAVNFCAEGKCDAGKGGRHGSFIAGEEWMSGTETDATRWKGDIRRIPQ